MPRSRPPHTPGALCSPPSAGWRQAGAGGLANSVAVQRDARGRPRRLPGDRPAAPSTSPSHSHTRINVGQVGEPSLPGEERRREVGTHWRAGTSFQGPQDSGPTRTTQKLPISSGTPRRIPDRSTVVFFEAGLRKRDGCGSDGPGTPRTQQEGRGAPTAPSTWLGCRKQNAVQGAVRSFIYCCCSCPWVVIGQKWRAGAGSE